MSAHSILLGIFAALFGIGGGMAMVKFPRQWPFTMMLWAIYLRVIIGDGPL